MRKKSVFALFLLFLFLGLGVWWGLRSTPKPKPLPMPSPPPTQAPVLINVFQEQVDIKNKSYEILYSSAIHQYDIIIYGIPFEPARQEAEAAFLKKLNSSPAQACQMKVIISTPAFVNPEESKQTYRLSFCSP